MPITLEHVESLLERLEKRFKQFQNSILEILMQQMTLNHRRLTDDSCNPHTDSTINHIHEFHFDGLVSNHILILIQEL